MTKITQELFTWFANNQINANHDKCHLLLSSHEDANTQIANVTIKSSTSKKLLGVTIENKLKFDKHVENICQKASRKLNDLARLVNYMDLPKRRILIHVFLTLSLIIALLFGCFTVGHLTTKLTGYMSAVLE